MEKSRLGVVLHLFVFGYTQFISSVFMVMNVVAYAVCVYARSLHGPGADR